LRQLTAPVYTRYSVWVKKESIVLIGMAGVGKSTIGSGLAVTLGFSFTDLDQYIREKDSKTIQTIIDTSGEQALLQLEKQRMYEIDLKRRVVAPGGSLIYHPDLMEYLKKHSIVVFLDDTFANIAGRIKNASTRGIVGFKSKSLLEIYEERRPLYTKYADIIISPAGKTREQVIGEILEQYLGLD
jgi:shikimate kinase